MPTDLIITVPRLGPIDPMYERLARGAIAEEGLTPGKVQLSERALTVVVTTGALESDQTNDLVKNLKQRISTAIHRQPPTGGPTTHIGQIHGPVHTGSGHLTHTSTPATHPHSRRGVSETSATEQLFRDFKALAEEYWAATDLARAFIDPATRSQERRKVAQAKQQIPVFREKLATMVPEMEAAADELGIGHVVHGRAPAAIGGFTFSRSVFRDVYTDDEILVVSRQEIRDFLHEWIAVARRGPQPPERDPASDGRLITIGHGRALQWLHLQTWLRDRGFETDEYDSVPTAGVGRQARLSEMLKESRFAFLVMTAEDEQPDGTVRARENVVHEVGLFQGRLGFERAIVLLEEGCQGFSNIDGLGQIRFPKDNIKASFDEVRRILEHHGLLRSAVAAPLR